MKRIFVIGLLTAGLVAGGYGQNIRYRQARQQQRIAQGIHNGSLTAGETARLERREARLNRQIRRERRDGGGLTSTERARINHQQNRLSRQIYRQKHDAQRRP